MLVFNPALPAPAAQKKGNLSRPSVSYFTHARSARLYGLTDSIVAPGRMPVDTCGATGGRPRYKQSGAFERLAAIDARLRLPFAHGVSLPDPFKKAGLARKPPEPARSGFSGLLSCFEQPRTILSGTATVRQTRGMSMQDIPGGSSPPRCQSIIGNPYAHS